MTTAENNTASQAGEFDPAPKYEYSRDGKKVTWTNRDRMPKVAAQAGDEPMRVEPCGWLAGGANDRSEEMYWRLADAQLECDKHNAYERSRPDFDVNNLRHPEPVYAQVSPRATADVEREKLPHGHRDDFYLMANARSLGMNSIHTVRSMPNWVLAIKLFATGSTSAHEICARAGIDPDGYRVKRATTKPGA